MSSSEKIGIVVVILFVAIVGFFVVNFLTSDTNEKSPDLPLSQSEEEKDPVIEHEILDSGDEPSLDRELSAREGILPDREPIQGSTSWSIHRPPSRTPDSRSSRQ